MRGLLGVTRRRRAFESQHEPAECPGSPFESTDDSDLTHCELKMEAQFPEIPAICQAARAVIRYRFRWQIPRLTAIPESQDPDRPGDENPDVQVWPLQDVQRNRQAAMLLSAGEVAAYIHLARQLGRQEQAGGPTLDQAVCLAIAGFPSDRVRFAQFLDTFLEDTRAELKTHWRQVETLADALLKRRELSPEETLQILENARWEQS